MNNNFNNDDNSNDINTNLEPTIFDSPLEQLQQTTTIEQNMNINSSTTPMPQQFSDIINDNELLESFIGKNYENIVNKII